METAAMQRQQAIDKHEAEMAKLAQAATAAQDEANRKLVEHNASLGADDQIHRQKMETIQTQAKAKRIAEGATPMDDEQFQEVTAKLDEVMQAIAMSAQGTMQALQEVAKATGRKKKVTTPDGRTYVSEPMQDEAMQ
jgi:hypothetical protein